MSIIRKIVYILLYGVFLAIFPVSINYLNNKFGVPIQLSSQLFISIILLSGLISKWQKLPKVNLILLSLFISCSLGYSVIVAIDHYVVDFFEPNIYWMVVAYIPLFVVSIKLAKKDE
jgi:hypothetical protein